MSLETILKHILFGGGAEAGIFGDYILRIKTLIFIIISIKYRYSRQGRHFTKTESPQVCFKSYVKEVRTIVRIPENTLDFPFDETQPFSNPNDQVGVTRPLNWCWGHNF